MKKVLLPILLLVAFGATSTFAQNVDITFELNAANITVDAGGLFIAGGGNFGDPGDNQLTDPDGDGIYSITISQPVGFNSFYTFTNGPCTDYSCKEDISGQACANPNNFNDRFLPWVAADTTVKACFGSCESDGTCSTPPTDVDVTFGVNVASLPAATLSNLTGIYVFGSFNGWNNNVNALTDDGNGLWTVTLPLPGSIDSFEYKFYARTTNDANNLEETFTAGDACTKTSGQFTNRIAALVDNVQPAFCWSICDICGYTDVNKVEVDENLFSINPSLVSNFASIMFSENVTNQEKQVTVLNAVGQVVYSTTVNNSNQLRIETANYANGMYFVSVQSENVRLTKKFVVSK